MTSFYSRKELEDLGLKSYGKEVMISRKASIYGASNIIVGNHVRIDDFCVLSGKIEIGDYVHVAAFSALYGGTAGIYIDDFANISARCCIYALSDDYGGSSLTNPTIPEKFKHVINERVKIEKHAIIGSGCTILPGVIIAEGSAIGAMSLCKKSTEKWKIYAGIPAKMLKDRKKDALQLEKEFRNENY